MSTMEELEARAQHVRVAELAAIEALAAGMRELAVELPEGSNLALRLAESAGNLAQCVDTSVQCGNSFEGFASLTISNFVTARMRETIDRLESEGA